MYVARELEPSSLAGRPDPAHSSQARTLPSPLGVSYSLRKYVLKHFPMEATLRTLAEPKRCEIVRLVWFSELPAAAIAAHFPDVTRSAISQHLGILRSAGLLTERRDGVRRLYSANHSEMEKLRQFIDSFWSDRLTRLRDLAESAEREKVSI